ncbi:S8 family serine peptidase [Pararhodonellum marinum]|uniref:S8 family serine peptidase n=1 Tax=Pararhodonellum marinum TaxID=2755358 RepID=UPI00188DCE3E|nr:S8 family serine peptidase [Pararhodonellum marinum]
MKTIFTTLVIFLLQLTVVFAQATDSSEKELEKARQQTFERLKRNFSKFQLSESERFRIEGENKFALEISLQDGFKSKLQYLDESGSPVYYTTFNTNSAVTTGTNALQPGGSLGVNLTGNGFTVGIFDQTRPKPDHPEFQSRLTQIDGSTETLSTHATHVSGTIMAAGLNANARGMAYESTGWAFNWESDISKMAMNAYDPVSKRDGMVVSNHSYGIVIGWFRNASNQWQWAGNTSISTNEDYRFGFYSAKSQAIDDLAFSRPYYTVVWAAGNDRNDRGDGTRDPDGPSDTIGPEGTAKNNITVGAVSAISNYTGPNSVQMSDFSSWGPVDDGRIKPDLVAVGVNVFSSSINNGQNSYSSQSGTSMAAPNVTGSLLLLQELYSTRNSGNFMLSSTLKALAIHTAREAGQAAGPDYIYGWGLLNAEEAGRMILEENGTSKIIREVILTQGQTYEFQFTSNGIDPIKTTIAWTDPSGNPPSPQLNPTTRMLVNDLDLRIFDDTGREFFPWTLDPSQAANATARNNADNNRDNVEQVVISSPQPRRYTVRVRHKGNLTNNLQQFSLIFSAGVSDGEDETLYWIGGANGNWNTQTNWSLSAGGASANKVPGDKTRVVFEPYGGQSNFNVGFTGNAQAFSLNLFGNSNVEFDLNEREIRIDGGFRASNLITVVKNGTLNFTSTASRENVLGFGNTVFDDVRIGIIQGTWRIISAESLDVLDLNGSKVNIAVQELNLTSLLTRNAAEFSGTINTINFKKDVNIGSGTVTPSLLDYVFSGSSGTFVKQTNTTVGTLVANGGNLSLNANGTLQTIEALQGKLLLNRNLTTVGELILARGTDLDLSANNKLVVTESIAQSGSGTVRSLISATGKGEIEHDVYAKYCFENIDVSNVDLIGDAIINLGSTSVLTNAENWFNTACNQVLFANFEYKFNCVGAIVEFNNLSEGDVDQYLWTFGDLGSSTARNATFTFDAPGEYPVSLRISNEEGEITYQQTVTIVPNDLPNTTIVVNGNVLTSQAPGSSYQWYLNGQIIPGATARSHTATNDGLYQVAIISGSCNRVSEPVVISSIPNDEPALNRLGIFVGPNPTTDRLTVTIANDQMGEVELSVFSVSGRLAEQVTINKNAYEIEYNFHLNGSKGMYIMLIKTNSLILHKKIIKK